MSERVNIIRSWRAWKMLGRIINGVHRIPAQPHEKSLHVPLTLIPSYPDLPMEKVFPRVPKTKR